MLLGEPKRYDFSNWEKSTTKEPVMSAQPEAVRRWVHGCTLDVASNYGRFSALSPNCVSIDMEHKFLVRGRETGRIKRAVVGDALSLPFVDQSFDTVLAMGIMDHIPPAMIPRFLDEVTRVVAEDGG
jgi:ubiquinone/menaquinone biosynthesis C-methylase UbiE